MPLTTETEEVDGTIVEPVLEEVDEQSSAPVPEPTPENQTEPASAPSSLLEPEPETNGDSSANMVYVPGFGYVENSGENQGGTLDDMYENGNKIGIMGGE